MKDETKTKIKNGWNKVKVPLIVTGTAVGAFALGIKVTEYVCANNLHKCYNAGLYKLVNPETGFEVSPEEWCSVLQHAIEENKI